MTKSEAVIRSILGAVKMDIRPLACAVDVAIQLRYEENIPIDEKRHLSQSSEEGSGSAWETKIRFGNFSVH